MAKIMVVDDESDIVILVQRILSKVGHEVIGASDGSDALERLKTNKPDLILLDIMMPRIDGRETLKLIRKQDNLRDIPVSMLTAKTLTPEILEREEVGELIDYIQKPITIAGLIGKVDELLKKLEEISEKKDKLDSEVEDKVAAMVYKNSARRECYT